MRHARYLIIGAALAVTVPLAACSQGQGTAARPTPVPSATAPASSAAAPSPSAPAASRETSTTRSPAAPARPAPSATTRKATPVAQSRTTSDLSGLGITGIRAGASVVLDVVDDRVDRFLQVGDGGRVDFTGTSRSDTTMMSLHPAAVPAKNRVVIKPPFWNEDLGNGSCVADTAGAALKLETCRPGKASQIWRVALAGDSGLFELHGAYGVISVAGGRITAGKGHTALQILPFAE